MTPSHICCSIVALCALVAAAVAAHDGAPDTGRFGSFVREPVDVAVDASRSGGAGNVTTCFYGASEFKLSRSFVYACPNLGTASFGISTRFRSPNGDSYSVTNGCANTNRMSGYWFADAVCSAFPQICYTLTARSYSGKDMEGYNWFQTCPNGVGSAPYTGLIGITCTNKIFACTIQVFEASIGEFS